MERIRLLPMELPSATNINGNNNNNKNNNNGRGRMSFIRRLGLGCIVLAALGLLYVPAYHSAQGPPFGIGETTSPAGSSGDSHFLASVAQLQGWTYNTSRNLNSYIHPENNTSIVNPSELCTPSPYLLIIVCSAVANEKARTAIRNTWATKENLHYDMETTVKVAFLLGESDNDTLNVSINEENNEHGDIIQEKFRDTYNNLTLKSVMMLKWVTTNCPHATYLMKTDDDMYLNIETLVKALKSRSCTKGTLIGSLICNARPISDPKNKWYTPKYMFSEKTYPNYLSGTGYVMSLDVALKLYHSALQTPLLHLEDVYITGLCARNAKLRPVNHPGFSYVPRKLDYCVLKGAITTHKVNSTIMHSIWNKLKDTNVTCTHVNNEKKMIKLNRHGRNIGYYLIKRHVTNRCT